MDDWRVWPPTDRGESEEDLPPSARWYGTPTAPPRRLPRWAARLLTISLSGLAAGAIVAGAAYLVLSRPDTPPETVAVRDRLAGVTFQLPDGWQEGLLAPVTGFTSVAAKGDAATVMARPGEPADPAALQPELTRLSDLYAGLLLHGDEITVVEDKELTVGDRPARTRALRAEYADVVNEPAYLQVTLFAAPEGKTVVLLGLAHPDDPAARADLAAIMASVR